MRTFAEIIGIIDLNPWVDRGLTVFFILFGLGEVMHHIPIAIVRLRRKLAQRSLIGTLVSGAKIAMALGPLYITFVLLGHLITSSHS